jgi:hypothetical protein
MRLAPSVENGVFDTWWDSTPSFWEQALRLFGFRSIRVQFHASSSYLGTPIPLYTVIASRA